MRNLCVILIFSILPGICLSCGSTPIIQTPQPPPPVVGKGGADATTSNPAIEIAAICEGIVNWAERVLKLERDDLAETYKIQLNTTIADVERIDLTIAGIQFSAKSVQSKSVIVKRIVEVVFPDNSTWRISDMGRFIKGAPGADSLNSFKKTLKTSGFKLDDPIVERGLMWVVVRHD